MIISDATPDAKRLLAGAGVLLVVEALRKAGGDVRFVGGCVRDCLLAVAPGDIDLATNLTPEAVTQALQSAGIKAVPTGIEHGTVTAVSEHRGIEITTLRRDVSTDGRRAVVAFTDDWREDASRRDFTMNALSLTPEGALHDYFSGREDLSAGRVRFIGDARQRIAEDGLRILRFFRFHARFGKGDADEIGLTACAEKAAMLDALSGERIRVEMLKLLEANGAVAALQAMASCRLFPHLCLERACIEMLEAFLGAQQRFNEGADAVLRLGALLRKAPEEDVTWLAGRWKLSNKEHQRLRWVILEAEQALPEPLEEAGLKKSIRRFGADAVKDALLLKAADGMDVDAFHALAGSWAVPVFPVTGEDLKKQGVMPGPEMGKTLARLEAQWEESGYSLNKEILIRLL
ncbi:MAG: CCA tRNA nucleotidyltransferase [Alphaproteobacteria bacterium]|nr:CCA tRNA nucleotidyltransferase [Alphaproteobacteria bacterium]